MNVFSDFAQPIGPLDGEKSRLDDILNKRVVIHSFRIGRSKYSENGDGNYLTIQLSEENNDNKIVVFTGSNVLREQCIQYEEKMPFLTTIRKVNQYYTFT